MDTTEKSDPKKPKMVVHHNQQQESKDKYQAGEAQGRYPKPAQEAKGERK